MYTDETKVSQILRNLVSNAIKFTERGEVRVSSVYVETTDTIALTVSDSGIGIRARGASTSVPAVLPDRQRETAEGERHRVWVWLFQNSSRTFSAGSISLKSEVGVGSQFTGASPTAAASGSRAGLWKRTRGSKSFRTKSPPYPAC